MTYKTTTKRESEITRYGGPAYGDYGVYTNPFGTGFYHGYVSGLYASRKDVLARYPDITDSQIELYLNGRDDGVKRDVFRLFCAGMNRGGRL